MKPRALLPRKRRLITSAKVTRLPVARPVFPDLLTVPEVAARLRCTPQAVYLLFKRDALASVKVGRKRLVTEAQLIAFIERNTSEARAS